MSYEHRRREETQKYLRKSCYHRIKCTVTTFLTAFMWRRYLNSEALATTTHKKPRKVSDGTGTQVISQTINKCKINMIQRELYNIKNLLFKGDRRNSRKKNSIFIYNCTQSGLIYMNAKLLGLRICSHLSLKFNSNLLWTCDNCCPNSLRPSFPTHYLQIYCLGLIGPTYFTLKFGPQIQTLQLVPFVGKTCALMSVTVKYGRIRSAPGRACKFSTTRWLSQS